VTTVTTVTTPLILAGNWGGHVSTVFDHPKKIAESTFHMKIKFFEKLTFSRKMIPPPHPPHTSLFYLVILSLFYLVILSLFYLVILSLFYLVILSIFYSDFKPFLLRDFKPFLLSDFKSFYL